MQKISPIWPCLACLALLAPFCPVGPFLASFYSVLPRLTLFGIIRHHLAPFGPDLPHLALLGHSSILISRYFKVPIRQGVRNLVPSFMMFLVYTILGPYRHTPENPRISFR